MISKTDIKLIRSLAVKKYRTRHGLFVAEGEKIVSDMLRDVAFDKYWKIRSVYHTGDWIPPGKTTGRPELPIHRISDKELKQCSLLSTPNKVLAVVEIPDTTFSMDEIEQEITLVLDAVRDPGNLGTIIRMAHWFGVNSIICSEDSVDLFNPKTIQSTMGSFLAVKVHYLNLADFLSRVKKNNRETVYGSYPDGENVYKLKPSPGTIIVMGNESTGIENRLDQFIDKKISIPSFSKARRPDSLNVAIAAGIILSEFRRDQWPSVSTDGH